MDELRIIKYLDGEMPAEELEAFEKEILMNPPLAEEIKKFREIQDLASKLLGENDGVEGIPGKEILEEIDRAVDHFKSEPDAHQHTPPEYLKNLKKAENAFFEKRGQTGSIITIHRIWFRAAALIILAIILSVFIFQPFSKPPPTEIFVEYNRQIQKTEEIIEIARSHNDFLYASEVYEAGDYQRAAALFETLSDGSELRTWSLLYSGSSYMYANQTAKAIDLLLAASREGDEDLLPEVRWRLALCYIKSGQTEEAMVYLNLLKDDPEYRRDAIRILRILQ